MKSQVRNPLIPDSVLEHTSLVNTLRKHGHAIYRKFFGCKKKKIFTGKKNNIFLILAQNIDCGYTLEPPNEYPQSIFWSKNKKKIGIPCIPQFCYIKVGFKGVYISQTCFPDEPARSDFVLR